MKAHQRSMHPRLLFYLTIAAVAAAVSLFEFWYVHHSQILGVVQGEVQELSPSEEKAVDTFMDMNMLVTTLGTGLLGELFFLIAQSKRRLKNKELLPAFLSFGLVFLSLYYGYQTYRDAVAMLQHQPFVFSLDNDAISWDRLAHLWTFVLGFFFFADFAFYELNKEGIIGEKAEAARA